MSETLPSLTANGQKLIDRLLTLPQGWVTAAMLAESISVSRRTVLRELPSVEQWIAAAGYRFVRSPGQGLLLDEPPARREQMRALLNGSTVYAELPRRQRRQKLLGMLLQAREPMKTAALARELLVSESTLAADLDIDSVTDIFIRINSKGVVLSQADFAMSKISSNEVYDGNITRKTIDYFCHLLESPEDLRDIQQNDTAFAARKEFEAIRWAASKVSPIYRTSYTDILRVAFTYKFNRGKLADLVSLLSGRDFENREFKIEIEEQSFYQLHEAVLQAVNQTNYERYLMIVRSAGIVRRSLIRSQNVLNFGYALFLALRERKVENSKIEQIVRRWLALSILTGRYSASPESSFDYDIKRFFSYDDPMEYLRITEAGELSDAYWSVNLVQRLNTSVASSPYFNLFLIAQVKAHDKGFLSTQIDVETMLENRGDIHHLFPKKYLIQHGIPQAQYNQIANYAFIQQEINIKIRDNAPSVYMREVFHQCETKQPVYGGIVEASALRENLRQNCIPDGFEDLEIHDYQQFLAQRRVLMAEKIHQYYDAL